ncbi:MAG: hypothetical protein KC620_01995 [Myxococcales bacterium]|nr:hypothetical protein [Myxococcales bacterium]
MNGHNPIRVMVLASLLAGGAAWAQGGPFDGLRGEMSARAAADGVPEGPLLRKIREGEAKHVPPPRVKAVVVRLHEQLVAARAVCSNLATDGAECIEAGAVALGSGATPEQLNRVLTAPTAPLDGVARARAFYAVADLQARGIDTEMAVSQVADALRAGGANALDRAGAFPAHVELPAPPAVGREGQLPVRNPTRDRDHSAERGKAKGPKENQGRSDDAKRPTVDRMEPPAAGSEGRPEGSGERGNSDD